MSTQRILLGQMSTPSTKVLADVRSLAGVAARAPQWVAGALVLALGVRAAYLVTDLAGVNKTALPPETAVALAPTVSRVDVPALLAANLFGSAQRSTASGPAPITQMPLVLVGVLSASDPKKGYAILGASAADAKLYQTGATLPGGGSLFEVHTDRVLISVNGSIEALLMPRQTAPAAEPPPAANKAPTETLGGLLQQNPGVIPDIIRPQVVVNDGKQLGFRAMPGPNRKAFDSLGLKPGDLVTAINGTPLTDPAIGRQVFASLSGNSSARLTVVRGDQKQDITIDVAQAQAELLKARNSHATPPDDAP